MQKRDEFRVRIVAAKVVSAALHLPVDAVHLEESPRAMPQNSRE